MNNVQLKRWRKVSLGLVKNAYPNMTSARRKKVRREVSDFIDLMAECYMDEIKEWDGGSVYVGDRLTEHLNRYEHYHYVTDKEKGNKFADTVHCCVRAGFDIAVAPSAGVIGFTAGDLRSCFAGYLPKWAANFFEPPLTADVPDSAGVWL